MKLVLPEPPEEGPVLVRKHTAALLRAMGHTPGEIEAAQPYPLHTLATEAVLGPTPLASARLTAWLYLLVREEVIIGLAELATDDAEGHSVVSFAALHPRGYAVAIAAKIAQAEVLTPIGSGDYELRVLRAPGLYALAVWLRGDDNILLPVEGFGPGVLPRDTVWKGSQIVTSDSELVRLLRPIARKRLTASD